MQLALRDDLILLPVTVVYQGQEVKVPDVVVDTGSATTMLSTDVVAQVGITPRANAFIRLLGLDCQIQAKGRPNSPNLVCSAAGSGDPAGAESVWNYKCVRPEITPELHDVIHVIRGVGGTEVVFSRRVDRLQVGPRAVEQFEIEVGGIDTAFDINGILGLDFLLCTGAIINLGTLQIDFPEDEGEEKKNRCPNTPNASSK